MNNITKAGLVALVGTWTKEQLDLVARTEENKKERLKIADGIRSRLYTAWQTAGGCETCNGRGSCYGRDGGDWSEWYTCYTCKGARNPAPSIESVEASEEYKNLTNNLRLESIELYKKLNNLDEVCLLKAGKQVRVYKGRKVAIGTEGEIVWHGKTRMGSTATRIRTSEGVEHWCDPETLAVVKIDQATIDAREKAKVEAQQAKAVEQDLLLESFGMPELKGTTKQVSWANNIRMNLARKAKQTRNETLASILKTRREAKYFIEERFNLDKL